MGHACTFLSHSCFFRMSTVSSTMPRTATAPRYAWGSPSNVAAARVTRPHRAFDTTPSISTRLCPLRSCGRSKARARGLTNQLSPSHSPLCPDFPYPNLFYSFHTLKDQVHALSCFTFVFFFHVSLLYYFSIHVISRVFLVKKENVSL